ncbi:MAG: metallophosphoesterase [Lachnospiraceae bacterium]
MKVLLVSDTHGRDELLEEILDMEKPDFFCHMGDVEGSEDYLRALVNCPLAIVRGNNDFYTDLPKDVCFELEGHKIFMTHGHYYYVSMGYEDIFSVGRKKGADIILFGHIHRPVIEEEQGIYLVNPGSLTFPRQAKRRPSYIVMDLVKNREPKFEIKYF